MTYRQLVYSYINIIDNKEFFDLKKICTSNCYFDYGLFKPFEPHSYPYIAFFLWFLNIPVYKIQHFIKDIKIDEDGTIIVHGFYKTQYYLPIKPTTTYNEYKINVIDGLINYIKETRFN